MGTHNNIIAFIYHTMRRKNAYQKHTNFSNKYYVIFKGITLFLTQKTEE